MKFSMNDLLQSQMREATRLTQCGRLTEATQVIQRAMLAVKVPAEPPSGPEAGVGVGAGASTVTLNDVLDGCVREIYADAKAFSDDQAVDAALEQTAFSTPTATPPTTRTSAATSFTTPTPTKTASFTEGAFVRGTQRHRYKLFTPMQKAIDTPLALVVMLHGCTQDPDDFALGTGMNAAASGEGEALGFYVLYPSQPRDVNPQGCWNWFDRAHQQRGRGEPAWIAELTKQTARTHGVDPTRVYIAGLSAGGAMAAVVAAAYPDVFAAVGVHSGLPVGAANNLTQALTAMKRGSSTAPEHPDTTVPTIVFHGDQDRTVHHVNGQALVAAAAVAADCTVHAQAGESRFGKKFTRSVYTSAERVQAEHWELHNSGHAWSGGASEGSYTDPRGIDATQEMLRFFDLHRLN